MLQILEFIANTIKNDSQIQGFVSDRIFPIGVDITPEETLFPLITFFTVSDVIRTVPLGARDGIYQVDVWSRLSQLETEQIAERIITIVNFTKFNTGYGTVKLRWNRGDGAVDIPEMDRRIWHKVLRFRTWSNN
jgi:hypothetical protein